MSTEAPRGRRSFYGRYTSSDATKKPGPKIEPRTDLTHVYSTESGRMNSLQGMRCKVLNERGEGRVRVEFEKGEIVIVHKDSLKRLPSRS